VPAFRYASESLDVEDIDVGDGKTQPGRDFTVIKGRRRLSALAPFATNPPKGEFFFQEVMRNGNNVSLQLLGSAVPGDEAISWTDRGPVMRRLRTVVVFALAALCAPVESRAQGNPANDIGVEIQELVTTIKRSGRRRHWIRTSA